MYINIQKNIENQSVENKKQDILTLVNFIENEVN
jgi:hypothetical protein